MTCVCVQCAAAENVQSARLANTGVKGTLARSCTEFAARVHREVHARCLEIKAEIFHWYSELDFVTSEQRFSFFKQALKEKFKWKKSAPVYEKAT